MPIQSNYIALLWTKGLKWAIAWAGIQRVKDFPAVLLALYGRGRAILF